MSRILRANQGGSGVKFVIIGCLLAVLLIGGVYLVQQRGEKVRLEQTIAQIEAEEAAAGQAAEPEEDYTPTDQSTDNATIQNSSTNTTSGDLPATGLDNVLYDALVMGCLSAALVALLASRKARHSL